MRPVLSVLIGKRLFSLRFGVEKYKSFSERYQGTRGIPIQWHYILGQHLSVHTKRVPDDRKYLRFDT